MFFAYSLSILKSSTRESTVLFAEQGLCLSGRRGEQLLLAGAWVGAAATEAKSVGDVAPG